MLISLQINQKVNLIKSKFSKNVDRTGINIERAKKQFKVFFVLSIALILFIAPISIYFYFSNRLVSGLFTLAVTVFLIISHLLYVRSRDKIEIIDYYSLKFYMQSDNKIKQLFKYIKIHFKSLILMLFAMLFMQITWSLTICQLTDMVSMSVMGFFFLVERLPFEYRFKSFQKNAVIDSRRSDQQIGQYRKKLKLIGWNETNREEFNYYLRQIDKELKIKRNHNKLLMRTTIYYNITTYIIFAIVIEIVGLISWSQWLKLII